MIQAFGLSFTGALLGLVCALGLWLIAAHLPWNRNPTLDERLAPYLRGVGASGTAADAGSRRRGRGGLRPAAQHLLEPFVAAAVRRLALVAGASGDVRRRLDQLGSDRTVEQFHAEQVVWGMVGAAAGAGVGLVSMVSRGASVVPVAGMVIVGSLVGVLGRDQVLSLQVRRREQRILAEFPAVAELLALSVAAGEGPMGALDRVARTCSGDLAAELRRTLADARTGASVIEALERFAARTSLPSVARFVDGVAVAIDRGTPLADVLRAQAQDVREASRRTLIETGGKKEIAMMIPVVFLVLPVTVLFAVYPGLAVLDLNP